MATSEKVKAAVELFIYSLLLVGAVYAMLVSFGCSLSDGERASWTRTVADLSAENYALRSDRSFPSPAVEPIIGNPVTPGDPPSSLTVETPIERIATALERLSIDDELEEEPKEEDEAAIDDEAELLRLLGFSTGGAGGLGVAGYLGFLFARRRYVGT
jgi:hypothetical protein